MTTYELPPEPPVGSRVLDRAGLEWAREAWPDSSSAWVPISRRAPYSWSALLHNHGPLTLIEPDPWPTAPLIVATLSSPSRSTKRLLLARNSNGDYVDGVRSALQEIDTLTNVVPVTVVPTAALPVLWSALEQWLNNGAATATEDTQRLVGAVESLRGQIDALGVDL